MRMNLDACLLVVILLGIFKSCSAWSGIPSTHSSLKMTNDNIGRRSIISKASVSFLAWSSFIMGADNNNHIAHATSGRNNPRVLEYEIEMKYADGPGK